eukprot:CAMPEP_0117687372 /NCGR_PEP_ID=MMETSP0804-20121206/23095_1 /TAXON_ID=1074897 /ORGANISM="Tetraselmis astigmatica, Strain CCMP880" /LENGTH=154 /DNA_ID=CAMNT_0005499421 /DNA_START=370 /DNA_END=835 /DNA_ORIENTATION=-
MDDHPRNLVSTGAGGTPLLRLHSIGRHKLPIFMMTLNVPNSMDCLLRFLDLLPLKLLLRSRLRKPQSVGAWFHTLSSLAPRTPRFSGALTLTLAQLSENHTSLKLKPVTVERAFMALITLTCSAFWACFLLSQVNLLDDFSFILSCWLLVGSIV